MDQGLRRSIWITLGLAVAAYAVLNHPLSVFVLGAIFAGVWALRGGSPGSVAKCLRRLQEAVIDAVFDRHAAERNAADSETARPMPAPESGDGNGEVQSEEQRTPGASEELSGMLRDLCKGEGEKKQAAKGYRIGDAPPEDFTKQHGHTGSGASPAPDYAGAVIGYREWLFAPRLVSSPDFAAGPAALYSLTQQEVPSEQDSGRSVRAATRRYQHWPLGETHEAGCGNRSNREGPDGGCRDFEGCVCGFYAWNEAEKLGTAGRKGHPNGSCFLVPGVIAGWGRVVLHERGFRCRNAKVVAVLDPGEISFPEAGDPGRVHGAYEDLVKRSGVPTLSRKELQDPGLPEHLGLLHARRLSRADGQ